MSSRSPSPLLQSAQAPRAFAHTLSPNFQVSTGAAPLPHDSRKAGAAYGESLGGAPDHTQTDRIIRAIDGIRKAQDEDKTGAKGTVISLKETERMDVFLARRCGETQVELCPGTYGKELFHSINSH